MMLWMSEQTCIDKMAFDNKKAAQDAARVAAYQHGSKLKAYKCHVCLLWHLTSEYDD